MDRISYQVVIVGGGPAGLACARVLHAKGINYLLAEHSALGGTLLADYDFQFMEKNRNSLQYAARICDFPVRRAAVMVGNVERAGEKWVMSADNQTIACDYLVLATGVAACTGGYEESDRMIVGPFKRAFQYSYQDKIIAILGGGDNAFEYAAIALKRGAFSVSVFARHIRAQPDMLDEAIRLGAEIIMGEDIRVADQPDCVRISGRRYDACLVMYGFAARSMHVQSNPMQFGERGRYTTGRGDAMKIYAIGDCVEGEMSIARAETSGAECGTLIAEQIGECGLDENAWRVTCEKVAKQAAESCGLSHDLYVGSFSSTIDGKLNHLPDAHRPRALEIAQEWDYASPAERAEAQQWNAENGFCLHGIELGCCPAGCGSGPDD